MFTPQTPTPMIVTESSVKPRSATSPPEARRASHHAQPKWGESGTSATRLVAAWASLLIRLSVLLRIFDTRQVGGARPGVQRSQKRVVARTPLEAADGAVRIVDVAEHDGLRRAGLLACGHHLAVGDAPVLDAGIRPGSPDPLDA